MPSYVTTKCDGCGRDIKISTGILRSGVTVWDIHELHREYRPECGADRWKYGAMTRDEIREHRKHDE